MDMNITHSSLLVKFFGIIVLFIIFVSYVSAQVVPEIRYNGRYKQYRQDFDGTIKIQFAVYDNETAGTILWESQVINNVKVSSGIFSTTFSPQLTDKQWENNLYLQVTIDDKKLSPREKLTYIPKSIYACNGVPTGAILIWSGSESDIPDGWVLCDGTNGTPDLRDRFVVGAGNTYSVNATGGEATHTLTIDEMPSHSHRYTDVRIGSGGIKSGDYYADESCMRPTENSGITSSSGNSQSHNNMPPYYSLCYIMRSK